MYQRKPSHAMRREKVKHFFSKRLILETLNGHLQQDYLMMQYQTRLQHHRIQPYTKLLLPMPAAARFRLSSN